ncbi:FAD-binding protein [Aureibacter tunicatorum]|uniref:FAD-binding PCMH-type domain-containing protein n=1 Tax=Aureibacter tunicatorum TaxID=866807 RepID=A0AAE3XLL2_9BACT|nr:FAD-binding protein [Aureibacter tunicatorum]MDR6239147.1 hypothetical protein [Aureibacter tunicatorum]
MHIERKPAKRSNWSRTENYVAYSQIKVSSPEDISEVIKIANETGKKIYVQGREHHWGACGESDESTIVISPDIHFFSEIKEIDSNEASIEIGASVRLEELNLHLANTSWALENMGAIAEQNVSALVSTNTHGAHPKKGGFSTLVQELVFVDADGIIHTCIRGHESWELAKFVLGSTGKAGVITSLRLKLVPSFNLMVEEVMFENSDALKQESFDQKLKIALENDAYLRWFLFPNSGTGKVLKDSEGCPLDTYETGNTQLTVWRRTSKNGKGRGWLRGKMEGFVANYMSKKIDKFLDKDFKDRDPDWLHKVTRLMIWLMSRPYSFVGRSDLALTAEPNMPIKSQIGSHTTELYFRSECAECVIKSVLRKIDEMASTGKCFVWKPMRLRVMSGDQDAYCSQVYDQNSSGDVYMTMDIDIYEGQFVGKVESVYSELRKEADKAILRYNQENKVEMPLTSFHLGKTAPLLHDEYGELFRSRPGIRIFIEYLKKQKFQTFTHPRFMDLFGLTEKPS